LQTLVRLLLKLFMIPTQKNRSLDKKKATVEPSLRKSSSQPTSSASPSPASSRRLYWLLGMAIVLIAGALWLRSSRPVRDYLLRNQDLPQLEAAVRRQPDDVVAQYYLGKQYYLSQRFSEARSAYQEAVRLDPNWARAHLGLALSHYELGELSKARAEFRETLRHDNRSAWAEYMLGKLDWRARNTDDALKHVRRAVELDPRSDQAWYGLAACLTEKRQYNEAIAALRKAVERKENNAAYHTGLGELLIFRGELAEGKQHYERALQINPDFGPACALLGRFYLQKATEPDALDRALELLQRATRLKTLRPAEVYLDLGQVYIQKRQYAKAIESVKASLRIESHDERPYYALANAYRRMGNIAEADAAEKRFREMSRRHVRLQNLEARVFHNPNSAEARLSLARLYREMDLLEQAANQYAIVLRLNPSSRDIQKELEALVQEQAASESSRQDFSVPLPHK
jgi:tetratricopeptide (TPR) repeat protein